MFILHPKSPSLSVYQQPQNGSPGTYWLGLGFSLSQSTFSSQSQLRSREKGFWSGFGTPSGRSLSVPIPIPMPVPIPVPISRLNLDDQGRSVWGKTVRSIPAKQLLGSEQHQGEERLAGCQDDDHDDHGVAVCLSRFWFFFDDIYILVEQNLLSHRHMPSLLELLIYIASEPS